MSRKTYVHAADPASFSVLSWCGTPSSRVTRDRHKVTCPKCAWLGAHPILIGGQRRTVLEAARFVLQSRPWRGAVFSGGATWQLGTAHVTFKLSPDEVQALIASLS